MTDYVTFTDLATNKAVMLTVALIRCVKEVEGEGTVIEFGPDHFVHVAATFEEVQEALGIETEDPD